MTRPDLLFPYSELSNFVQCPQPSHTCSHMTAEHALRCLHGTYDFDTKYHRKLHVLYIYIFNINIGVPKKLPSEFRLDPQLPDLPLEVQRELVRRLDLRHRASGAARISHLVSPYALYWAGDTDTRRSNTGYVLLMNGGPISWKSQRQDSLTLSTKAHYQA
jgi:hypothetical protein